jgi:hypothetical protein
MKGLIKKGPDVSQAATVGEPPLVDPEPVSPRDVTLREQKAFLDAETSGSKSVGVEVIHPNQPANATPPADIAPSPNAFGTPPPAATPPAPAAVDPNELKPNQPSDPNELTPTAGGSDSSLPPPTQVNEIQNQSSSSNATMANGSTLASDEDISSSKKKRKKGLKKISPF